MHELSIVASLFEILEDRARDKKAKRILFIKVQVGALSGIVPEFLKTAFDIYKKDTIAEKAELGIEKVPLTVECPRCGHLAEKEDFVFICDKCGSPDLKILSGTELLLEKMELEID